MAASDDNDDNANHLGRMNGHGVGIAIIAIFAGMALVVAFAASDGAIFGQNFQSTPSSSVPVSDSSVGDAAAVSRDVFNQGSVGNSSTTSTLPPQDGATLSAQERQLLAINDFPWDSVAGRYIASSQVSIQTSGQQSVAQQRPLESGIEPLSLSDEVAVEVDRNSNRDRDRDDSDDNISLADIIGIDIPIANDDEERQKDDEQPDEVENDAPEDDHQGSDDGTENGSSGEGSGGDSSGSGSDGGQSGESGNDGESDSTNSTDNSDPSENSGSGNAGNDTVG